MAGHSREEAQLDAARPAVHKAKEPQVIHNSDDIHRLNFHTRHSSISVANCPQKYRLTGVELLKHPIINQSCTRA